MKRLPRYDNNIGRSELAAYLALGMAGAALTVQAFFGGLQPASEPKLRSMQATSERNEVVVEKTNVLLTNILFIQQPASSGQAPPLRSLAAPQG